MTKRHGKNVGLDKALAGLVGKLDRKNAGAYTTARAAVLWQEVAGPIVSAHTTGVHLRDNVLVVHVDSHARANDLAALSERYRVAMNEGLGKELIRKVSFTVSRKVAEEHGFTALERETREFYREDEVEPVPLTERERKQIESSASAIPDEALREAVVRATVADLEWKRGIAARNARQAARDGS